MKGLASSVPAVRVEGVVKRFGATVALDGAGLEVPGGMVFGLLGPNGAGKTTLVRFWQRCWQLIGGRAEVFGHDVVREPAAVRELLGLTGQFAAVDELLTGRENLEMFGRLFKLSREEARRRFTPASTRSCAPESMPEPHRGQPDRGHGDRETPHKDQLADSETASDLRGKDCGARGTRTPDPVLAKHVLFQLSYSPARRAPRVPAAGERSGRRSPGAARRVPLPAGAPPGPQPPAFQPRSLPYQAYRARFQPGGRGTR